MFSVIHGDGAGERPVHHFEALARMTRAIESGIKEGNLLSSQDMARNLTPIERGVVATRMVHDGVDTDLVLQVLA